MKRRLFFALAPPADLRRRLDELAAALPAQAGRRVKSGNLHLTLRFLGGVEEELLPELQRRAAGVRAAPFTLELTHAGCWKKAGILWLGTERTPPALASLAAALEEIAVALGLPAETRPYRPHVTLLRRLRGAPQLPPFAPLRWDAADFRLMESITHQQGPEYRELARWPLAGS